MKSSYKRIHKLAEANRWLKANIEPNNLVLCTLLNDDTLHPLYGIISSINKSIYNLY